MAANTYAAIAPFVNAVYEDALFAMRDQNLMLPLVTVYRDMQGMAPRKVSEYGTATVNAIGEMDDLASQSFDPSLLNTLTPSEYGAQFFITDQRIESDPFGVRNDASVELGSGAADAMERALIGDFASLTGGTIGAAGTVITWGHVGAAISRLRVAKAPRPWVVVLHPYQWHPLAKAAAVQSTVTNAPEFQNSVQRDFYVGTAMGAQFYTSTNVPVDGSDDATGAVFSADALALDIRRAPRIEPERDASRRGWELNLSLVFAHGVRRPSHGIKLLFDASAPTS